MLSLCLHGSKCLIKRWLVAQNEVKNLVAGIGWLDNHDSIWINLIEFSSKENSRFQERACNY